MTNESVSGNFDILNIVLWRPFKQHGSHIFSFSNFRRRYLDDQSEYRKALWIKLCSHFARAAASDTGWIQYKNFWSFQALPAPDPSIQGKSLKLYFYRNLQLLSFLKWLLAF